MESICPFLCHVCTEKKSYIVWSRGLRVQKKRGIEVLVGSALQWFWVCWFLHFLGVGRDRHGRQLMEINPFTLVATPWTAAHRGCTGGGGGAR
jgi:hypothetical protein